MSSASTAAALQHLLEAEGAVIHAALQTRALPSMGGGVGMVLTTRLSPGSTLARFPFRSMITARKARFNLAMAEVALELRKAKGHAADLPATDEEGEELFPVLPFTSRVWSEAEFESQVRSQKVRRAIDAKAEELAEALDSTETIVCYVLLMSALYGRWQEGNMSPSAQKKASDDEEAFLATSDAASRTVLRYTHENRWMRTWLLALPVQYDNLLELAPRQSEAKSALDTAAGECTSESTPPFSGSPSSPVPPLSLGSSYTTSSEWLRLYVSLARFRATALSAQLSIAQRYRKCYTVLQSLRNMPVGVEVDQEKVAEEPAVVESESRSDGQPSERPLSWPAASETLQDEQQHATACTLGHFLWAFNTLMSRGFYYPEETWALMPYVDYFNYALEANGTMYPQEDDPDKAECLTNVSFALINPAFTPADAPRKQARRTGLRTARVGRATIPQANYNTYEFQLVHPVRAAGDQVMLHYGAYSDIELLLWYGFTLRPSLLPTSHIPFREAEASTLTTCFPPLLPPHIAGTGNEHSLLHTAQALRVLLPQMAHASTRLAHYRRHILPSGGGSNPAAAEGDGCDSKEAEEAEDYSTWTKALQRAYRLPLSPLADAEGSYPPAVRGQTWIDVLFESFAETPPVSASSANGAAVELDEWVRQWVAQRWPCFADTAFPHVAKECGLGVFGLSPALHAAITSSFWAEPRQARMSTAEQVRLVRGLAWAELYVNLRAQSSHEDRASTCSPTPVSAAAAAFAQIASVDQWALLRFLALEGSDAALEAYVAYECETD